MNFKQELDEIPSDDNQDLKSFIREFSEIKNVKNWNCEMNPPSWIKKEAFVLKTEQFDLEEPSTEIELTSVDILEEPEPEELHIKIEPVDSINVEEVHNILSALDTTSQKNSKSKQIFQCAQCDFKTAFKARLKRHLKFHSEVKPFTCTLCSYKTVDKSNLRAHLKVHAGVRPHNCTICDYRSSSKSALKGHMTSHTGEKLHKCEFCSFSSGYKASLKNHIRIHTGERPFKCYQCSYCGTTRATVKKHEQIHSYKNQCIYCEYKGKAAYALRRHVKANHSVMEPRKTSRKWCIVPQCESTSTETPVKLFISVPRDEKRRYLWIKAVRRNPAELSKLTYLMVCEDHFNLETDMENYVRFKLMGGLKRMKTDVVPHIFKCQKDPKGTTPKSPRDFSIIRARHPLNFEELLSSAGPVSDVAECGTVSNDNSCTIEPSASTSKICSTKKEVESLEFEATGPKASGFIFQDEDE